MLQPLRPERREFFVNQTLISMKRNLLFAALLALSLPLTTLAQKAVKARSLEGYFLKSSVKDAAEKPYVWVFDSEEEFKNAFGAAATASLKPSAVNFEKEAVVALAAPKTKQPTILSMNVTQKGETLMVNYKMKPEGAEASFTRQPVTLVAIPKTAATGREVVVYNGKEEVQRIGVQQ